MKSRKHKCSVAYIAYYAGKNNNLKTIIPIKKTYTEHLWLNDVVEWAFSRGSKSFIFIIALIHDRGEGVQVSL